jgi:hypothetical protein
MYAPTASTAGFSLEVVNSASGVSLRSSANMAWQH